MGLVSVMVIVREVVLQAYRRKFAVELEAGYRARRRRVAARSLVLLAICTQIETA